MPAGASGYHAVRYRIRFMAGQGFAGQCFAGQCFSIATLAPEDARASIGLLKLRRPSHPGPTQRCRLHLRRFRVRLLCRLLLP